jgi:hypothetical protein
LTVLRRLDCVLEKTKTKVLAKHDELRKAKHPQVRRRLGWEWLVESWLRREAEAGRLRAGAAQPSDPLLGPNTPVRPRRVSGVRSGRPQDQVIEG